MAIVPVSETEYRTLLLAELGQDEESAIALQFSVLWRMAGALSGGNDLVRYLRTKRAALEFLLIAAHEAVDIKEGDASESWSGVYDHLLKLAQATDAALKAALQMAGGRRGPVVGQLTRTAPRMPLDPPPATFPIDANDPAYRGDPYRRS